MQMIKRTLSIVLTVVMLVSMFSMVTFASAAWDGTVATAFEGGSGTEADPYIIVNAEQLALMSTNIAAGTDAGAYYKLGADITLNEGVLDADYNILSKPSISWTSGGEFTGVFDGDGHTIYGFYSGAQKAGLFGKIKGTVKNLKMKDACVDIGWTAHGILASEASGATIQNVEIDGANVKNHAGASHARGMMIGQGSANLTDCIVRGKTTSASATYAQICGSFIGRVTGASTFTNCVNFVNADGMSQVGGFIGLSESTTTFTDCINYGNITSNTAYNQWVGVDNVQLGAAAGGFIAVDKGHVTFTRCANEGTIIGDGYAGGFVGVVISQGWYTIAVNNSYNIGSVSCIGANGREFAGDFIGTQYRGTYTPNVAESGDLAAYQAGEWLGDEAILWSVNEGTNPTLKLLTGEEVGEVHKHTYTSVTTDPTCTTAGKTVYTCECGDSYEETIPATGHVNGDPVIVNPDCVKFGTKTYSCVSCGQHSLTLYTKPTGHTLSIDENGVVTCADCDYTKTYSGAAETIDFRTNDFTGLTGYLTAPAAAFVGDTINHPDSKRGQSEMWGGGNNFTFYLDNGYVASTGPMYNWWIYYEGIEESDRVAGVFNCDNGVAQTYTFDKAGTYYIRGLINDTSYWENVATIEVFDAPETEAPHEHVYTAETTDATCTEAGKTVYTCECGDSYEEEIAALGHTEVTETVDATCTIDGATIVKCSVCGDTLSATVIPAKGHTEVTETVDATCTTAGSITVTCDVCGTVISETVIEATGHNYVDGKCECGEIDAACVAQVGDKYFYSFADAYAAAEAGDTITLLADITADAIITIDKAITLDGNGKTLTSTAGRAINVDCTGDVTIEDLTIVASGERAINIINQPATVTINNVTATAKNYAVNLATSAGAANVTINDSDLTGLAVVNVASAGAYVEINDTKLTNVDANPNENYGAITVYHAAENATVNVNGGEIIVADDSRKAYVFADSATVNGIDDVGMIAARIGDAGYETFEEALADAEAGDTITVIQTAVIDEDMTIANVKIVAGSKADPAIRIVNGATVTFENVTIDAAEYCVTLGASDFSSAGNLIIKSGSYHGNVTAISVTKGNLVIEGGSFSADPYQGSYTYLINCIDSSYRNGTATVTISGGTFANWNPQDNAAEGAGSDFCADGFDGVDNGDGTFGVVLHVHDYVDGVCKCGEIDGECTIQVGDKYYKTFAEAYAAAGENGTIHLLDTAVIDSATIIENVTITAAEGVNPAIRIVNNAFVAINNVTMDIPDGYCFILGASDFSSAGNLHIYSGTYHGDVSVVSVTKGELVIRDGNFSVDPYNGNYAYLINCIDSSYRNGTATVSIRGGNFENWNPQDNAAEGAGSDFCADGFEGVENEDGSFSVIVHEHAYDAVTTDPTCTEAGKTVYTCRCGDTYEEEIDALGHTEETTTVDATCTEAGSITVTCTVCGETISTEVIEALGHTEETTTVDATCTADGSITVTCDVCGETLSTEVIPATGHNYVDGACDVCGEADPDAPVGPTYVEGLVIAGKNVAFAADYTMVFAVSKANYEAYDEVYLEVQKKLYDGEVEFESATLTETEILNGMYAFRYKNFAAREIASEVKATVYAKDADGNVYYGPTLTYSMREYAQNQIVKSKNEYFKTMMVDFLNYGAAAQNYFGYNTGDLANKNIDAYQDLATKDVTIEDVKGGQTDTSYAIDITNFNLIFKSKITMVFATNLDDAQKATYADNAYAKITYTTFEGEAMEVEIPLNDPERFTTQGGKWCVLYDGIKAREMDKVVTVAIYDNEGNQISNEVTYSVNSYAYSKLNNTNANLVALVNTMARFGFANQEYNRNK